MWEVQLRSRSVELVEVERPTDPDDGNLLVHVESAALNGTDVNSLRKAGPDPVRPGVEFAGRVLSVGRGISAVRVGDRVMGLTAGGAHAEIIEVPAATCLSVPAWMPITDAGAFCEVFTTAHDALTRGLRLSAGDRLLISGGAGGVGTAAVQLAAAMGAEVVVSVRDPRLRPRTAELAAGVVAIAPEELEDHGPYTAVLELVGGANLAADIESLSMDGRIFVIGTPGGDRIELDLSAIKRRRAVLSGSTLKSRSLTEKAAALRAAADFALPRLKSEEMRSVISLVFPFPEAGSAYQAFADGGKFGKVVLVATNGAGIDAQSDAALQGFPTA